LAAWLLILRLLLVFNWAADVRWLLLEGVRLLGGVADGVLLLLLLEDTTG
jgi:hypothetical protein